MLANQEITNALNNLDIFPMSQINHEVKWYDSCCDYNDDHFLFPSYFKLILLISMNSSLPSPYHRRHNYCCILEISTENMIFFYAPNRMSFRSIDQGKGFISFLFYLANLCVIFLIDPSSSYFYELTVVYMI